MITRNQREWISLFWDTATIAFLGWCFGWRVAVAWLVCSASQSARTKLDRMGGT